MAYDEALAARGWLTLAADDVTTKKTLAAWVERGVSYARSLPAK